MGPCPPGTQATVDMRFCEPCKGDDFNLVAGGVCRPCPLGAKCIAGDHLEALPDWWCVPKHAALKRSRSRVEQQACCKYFCDLVLVSYAFGVPLGA